MNSNSVAVFINYATAPRTVLLFDTDEDALTWLREELLMRTLEDVVEAVFSYAQEEVAKTVPLNVGHVLEAYEACRDFPFMNGIYVYAATVAAGGKKKPEITIEEVCRQYQDWVDAQPRVSQGCCMSASKTALTERAADHETKVEEAPAKYETVLETEYDDEGTLVATFFARRT